MWLKAGEMKRYSDLSCDGFISPCVQAPVKYAVLIDSEAVVLVRHKSNFPSESAVYIQKCYIKLTSEKCSWRRQELFFSFNKFCTLQKRRKLSKLFCLSWEMILFIFVRRRGWREMPMNPPPPHLNSGWQPLQDEQFFFSLFLNDFDDNFLSCWLESVREMNSRVN